MKRTWLGFIVSLAFILSGCGTVVYQVRPDAPPWMGYEEAMEAMELAILSDTFARATKPAACCAPAAKSEAACCAPATAGSAACCAPATKIDVKPAGRKSCC